MQAQSMELDCPVSETLRFYLKNRTIDNAPKQIILYNCDKLLDRINGGYTLLFVCDVGLLERTRRNRESRKNFRFLEIVSAHACFLILNLNVTFLYLII
jgi:hypothetical protein